MINIENFMWDYLKKHRVPIRQIKFKYDQLRVYTNLECYCLLDIINPGYGYYPRWLVHFDIYYGEKLLYYTGIQWLSHFY